MTPSRSILIRLITIALFSAVLAGTWDVWWHGALGRETFWSPPHLLLYTSVLVAIGTGLYGWWLAGRSAASDSKEAHLRQGYGGQPSLREGWKWLAIVLSLVPASAPFDELWHRIFGVEPVNSPLIVWSPPHLILAFALIGSFFFLFTHLHRDEDITAKHLLQSAALASITSLFLFVASPLEPTGPYHLAGFLGAGVGSGIISAIFLLAQERMRRFGSATTVAAIVMLLSAMNFGEKLTANINIQPHDHTPGWLMIFSYLVPAALIDLLRQKPLWLRGGIIGLLQGGLLYGFSLRFFEVQFQYSSQDMWIAVGTSLLAGLLVGWLLSLFTPSHSPNSP